MTRARRRLLVVLAAMAVFAAAVLFVGRPWAEAHVRQHAAAGDPPGVSCLRCHGLDPAPSVPKGARPTPWELAVDSDGRRAFVVCAPQRRLLVVDLEAGRVVDTVPVDGVPGGVALSPDGSRIAVTLEDRHEVVLADARARKPKVVARHATGTEPRGVAFTADGARLVVANAGGNDISVVDLGSGRETRRATGYEPFVVTRSPDGRTVAVVCRRANAGLPDRLPDFDVTLLDGSTGAMLRRVTVPSTHMAEGAAWAPDGSRLFVPAVYARNLLPIVQVARGWVMSSVVVSVDPRTGAFSLLPITEPALGFGDPAGASVSPDGKTLLVLAGGGNEAALVDTAALRAAEPEATPDKPQDLALSARYVRGRVPLASNPRGLALARDRWVVTERLNDSVAVLDLEGRLVRRIVLDDRPPDALRHGEQVFHDAHGTFQGHFSCRSCHPGAHTDGLTYDFELDGVGREIVLNRSLLGLAGTEPFKWTGLNPTVERQCGPRFAMVLSRADVFSEQGLKDLVAWILSLAPPRARPDRSMLAGRDWGSYERGRKLFERVAKKDGTPIPPIGRCVTCHPLPHGTGNKRFDVNTKGPRDNTGLFDTPHLTGIASKAPYLHDGRATTLEEIWTLPGVGDSHGVVSDFTKADLNDLIEFMKGL